MRQFLIAAAMAASIPVPAVAQQDCAALIAPACLAKLGAGSIPAVEDECVDQMTAYSQCLVDQTSAPSAMIGRDEPVEIGAMIAFLLDLAKGAAFFDEKTGDPRIQILDVMDGLGETVAWTPRSIEDLPGEDILYGPDMTTRGVKGEFRALINGAPDRDRALLRQKPWGLYIVAGRFGFNDTEVDRIELVRKFHDYRVEDIEKSIRASLPDAKMAKCPRNGAVFTFDQHPHASIQIGSVIGSDGAISNLVLRYSKPDPTWCDKARQVGDAAYTDR